MSNKIYIKRSVKEKPKNPDVYFVYVDQDMIKRYSYFDGSEWDLYSKSIKYWLEEVPLEEYLKEIGLTLINNMKQEEIEYEPYFGWCNVEGCNNEGSSGGNCWKESGYWTVCSIHSEQYRKGLKQPKMKQWAIDREKTRLPDGTLPPKNQTTK